MKGDAPVDCRLDAPAWDATDPGRAHRLRATLLAVLSTIALALYFSWLLRPGRVGNPVLFAVLVAAELFNVAQALGFWWTCLARRRPTPERRKMPLVDVDVFIPTYSEPAEIIEATVAAASRLVGARVHVALLDDGNREEMVELARRHGIRYVRRTLHQGAKAGNINHALGRTTAPYVLVLDCDHVPHPDLLIKTLPEFAEDTVAYVQTPQYYANAAASRVAAASWSQQALFFGPIARGKDAHEAMFCCGTNVVFRRHALEAVGGFPSGSLTEDFAISLELHERGWRSVYVPEVLASGLGPEDLASYVSQQHRWARGCIGIIPRVLRADLPLRRKAQYLLSASYFLTGWTVLVYLSMPVVRILTGAQPVAGAAADSFLAAFGPYFALSLATVASVGAGQYTFAAYSLATSTFWIHVHATYRTVRGRAGSFVVTPKRGAGGRQLRPAAPTLFVIAILVGVAVYGLSQGRDAATLNNVAFAALHVAILGHGVAAAVAPSLAAVAATSGDQRVDEAAA
jgi:cellulose synthase (UDP-forming)